MKKFLISALAAASIFGAANAADYTISPDSKVAFSVKHLKLMQVEGNFGKFAGKASYADGKLSAFEGTVEIASVNTENQKRDDHLRANDIFDAATHPQMSFKMSDFADGKINGVLNVKGKDHKLSLDAEVNEGNDVLNIKATGTVKRSELGVVWEESLKDSMVSDEVTINLELKANK